MVSFWRDQDEIVITGISGRFPESDNMDEFASNLMSDMDLVTEDERRWEPGALNCRFHTSQFACSNIAGYYGLPKRHGKLKDVTRFDAQFFGIVPKQANVMDPQLRILLEVTYEAILDAGMSSRCQRFYLLFVATRGSLPTVYSRSRNSQRYETCLDASSLPAYNCY